MSKQNNRLFGYGDMRENFPHIFRVLWHGYHEDSLSDESRQKAPMSVFWTRKRGKASIQRTKKRQIAERKKHLVERDVRFTLPNAYKNNAPHNAILILRFFGDYHIGYVADTNIGRIAVRYVDSQGQWVAHFRTPNSDWPTRYAFSKKSPHDAIARLCGQKWAMHKFTGVQVTLYDLYNDIHFWFEGESRKKPRNNTLKIRVSSEFILYRK